MTVGVRVAVTVAAPAIISVPAAAGDRDGANRAAHVLGHETAKRGFTVKCVTTFALPGLEERAAVVVVRSCLPPK